MAEYLAEACFLPAEFGEFSSLLSKSVLSALTVQVGRDSAGVKFSALWSPVYVMRTDSIRRAICTDPWVTPSLFPACAGLVQGTHEPHLISSKSHLSFWSF